MERREIRNLTNLGGTLALEAIYTDEGRILAWMASIRFQMIGTIFVKYLAKSLDNSKTVLNHPI